MGVVTWDLCKNTKTHKTHGWCDLRPLWKKHKNTSNTLGGCPGLNQDQTKRWKKKTQKHTKYIGGVT